MCKKFFFLFALLFFLSACGAKTGQAPDLKNKAGAGMAMETVLNHNTAEDCWLVVNNNVYSVSGYIASHPGGKIIADSCGKDATELFESRLTGSGTAHSDRARDLLEKYYIGSLKK